MKAYALRVSDFCFVAAQIAANGFKPVSGAIPRDEYILSVNSNDNVIFMQGFAIEEYLSRCIRSGELPVRSAPLFGKEPLPLPTNLSDYFVFIRDFQAWMEPSGVRAPESWVKAVIESINWHDEAGGVTTGTPKGRPPKLPDKEQLQKEANDIALELYRNGQTENWQKRISNRLADKYTAKYDTVKDRFKVKICNEYIESQKPLKQ